MFGVGRGKGDDLDPESVRTPFGQGCRQLRTAIHRDNKRQGAGQAPHIGRREGFSPFGLHWPTLDEDLSFEGILAGRYGQR